MNTYEQDTTIPIYIMLQYDGLNAMKFPINPETLKVNIDSASTTTNVEGIGEVSVTSNPKLAKLSIASQFWHENNLLPSFLYVNWIKKWQKSKKPAKLIVTRFNYSMTVTCESFWYETRAGEEEDVYFELSMQEYRPYGARRLNATEADLTTLQKLKMLAEEINDATLPVLVEIPRPSRSSSSKKTIGETFKVVSGYKTLTTITKKLTGGTKKWQELYNTNQEIFGEAITAYKDLENGTVLTIPKSWRS